MKPLLFLANIFINTFGITQPSSERAERAARFIGVMMLVVLVVVIAVAFFVVHSLYR